MQKYGKIVDGKLIIAENKIITDIGIITNPKEQDYINNGWKPIYEHEKPTFNKKEEKLEENWNDLDDGIILFYDVVSLTDEEHNEIINNEIIQKENLISTGLIATALLNINKGTKDNSAMTEIEKILSKIDSLKKELRGK